MSCTHNATRGTIHGHPHTAQELHDLIDSVSHNGQHKVIVRPTVEGSIHDKAHVVIEKVEPAE